MIYYGIRRIVLINSARASLCELPIDAPLSLTGPNNIGKSSIINALQFLFLSDMNEMLFPGYPTESTKRHYFPTAESFVLAELATENGVFVIGAAGLGPVGAYDYQLFAYQGSLNRNDYIIGEGDKVRCANLRGVEKNLLRRKIVLRLLKRHEMRQALMGQNLRVGGEPFTIGMVRLKRETDDHYALFVRIFKNLLHMRDTTAAELKKLFIDIFQPNATTDFVGKYHDVMRKVEELKQDLSVRASIADDVAKLAEINGQYQGHLLVMNRLWAPIQTKYTALDSDHNDKIRRLEAEKQKAERAWQEKKASREPLQKRLVAIGEERAPVDAALKRIREGDNRFALVRSREDIERQREAAEAHYNEQRDALARLGARELPTVEREHREAQENLTRTNERLQAIGNNLFHWLASRFTERELVTFANLFSNDLLGHEIGSIITISDPEALEGAARDMLSRVKDEIYDDGRLRIDLQSIAHADISSYLSEEKLRSDHAHYAGLVERLAQDLETARRRAAIEQECERAAAQLAEGTQFLADYDAYHSEKANEADYGNTRRRLESAEEEIQDALRKLDGEVQQALGYVERLATRIKDETMRYNEIRELNRKVRPADAQSAASEEPRLPEDLLAMMETYVAAYEEVYGRGAAGGRPIGGGLKREIQLLFETIEAKGGAQFARGNTPEEQIRSLQEAVSAISESRAAWKKAEEGAIQELGGALKVLRNAAEGFKSQVQTFNRRIGGDTISNLKKVAFDVQFTRHYQMVNDLVSSTELWGDAGKARTAFENLARSAGTEKLGLDSLFTIGINVTQNIDGNEETRAYPSLNVESEGTGLTVRMLVNMLLLSELRSPRKGQQVRIPIYLDEASRLEEKNQRNIIAMADRLGFVPILASVEPQDTTTYWVGLEYESATESRIAVVTEDDWWSLKERVAPATVEA